MRFIFSLCVLFLSIEISFSQQFVDIKTYLDEIRSELKKQWPVNRTVNIVFHGHSVPSGYFKTPNVKTLEAYPHLVLRLLKKSYPYAVVNVITTSIGGENSTQGVRRFKKDVLTHHPDVLLIDYALNDRNVSLAEAQKAWEKMIVMAKKKGVKVILCTPSPDKRVSLLESNTILDQHSNQIRSLAKKHGVGIVDSYRVFKDHVISEKGVNAYMSTVNHPNEAGHELIAKEIMNYFIQ